MSGLVTIRNYRITILHATSAKRNSFTASSLDICGARALCARLLATHHFVCTTASHKTTFIHFLVRIQHATPRLSLPVRTNWEIVLAVSRCSNAIYNTYIYNIGEI